MPELASVCAALGIPKGKTKTSTVANLVKATASGKANVKMVCTISFKPKDGSASRVTHFGKTLRTYVSGPGDGDVTWLVPANAVPGSPAPLGGD
jgi:hypothetical protein